VLQCGAEWCSVLQCAAVRRSAAQCVAVNAYLPDPCHDAFAISRIKLVFDNAFEDFEVHTHFTAHAHAQFSVGEERQHQQWHVLPKPVSHCLRVAVCCRVLQDVAGCCSKT